MTTDAAEARSAPPLSRRLMIGVFAALSMALVIGYVLFLRTDYVLLYADLKPADASAIVAQLDAKGIPHELRDGGTTIMVPAADADSVRLAVAGSDIPMKGSVGFELFHKSDMGLTDFAQKINYQRALQGELTRTIMLMEGIETARVHLAIPERSLFRGNRSAPKAAVEVVAKVGRPLTPERIAGIRQLVASAVPDLVVNEVAILDGEGRVVSQVQSTSSYATPEIEEQAAAQAYYAARAKGAVRNVLPGLQIGVRVAITGAAIVPLSAADEPDTAPSPSPAGARTFPLRLTVSTAAPINPEDQTIARNAIADAIGLDEERGDALVFELGTTDPAPAVVGATAATPAAVPDAIDRPTEEADTRAATWWWVAGLAVLAIAVVGLVRSRRRGLPGIDQAAFVTRLRAQTNTLDSGAGRG